MLFSISDQDGEASATVRLSNDKCNSKSLKAANKLVTNKSFSETPVLDVDIRPFFDTVGPMITIKI